MFDDCVYVMNKLFIYGASSCFKLVYLHDFSRIECTRSRLLSF